MKTRYDFSRAKRGAIARPARGRTRITIRIEDAILDWLRRRVHAARGGSYQTLINEALRQRLADAHAKLDALNREPPSDEQIDAEIRASREERRVRGDRVRAKRRSS